MTKSIERSVKMRRIINGIGSSLMKSKVKLMEIHTIMSEIQDRIIYLKFSLSESKNFQISGPILSKNSEEFSLLMMVAP